MRANALVVMAKAPLAGQVKTRLLSTLNAAQAARLAKTLLVDQLNHLRKMPAADLYLAFAPGEMHSLMEELAPPPFAVFPQQGDDLGARMQAVFGKLLCEDYKNIVLIGGDLAPVPLRFLDQAYGFLDAVEHRVVLGPSRDGGYYLVGCNQPTPELFREMSWSHHAVLTQTLSTLKRSNVAHDLLPIWFDVDTVDDVRELSRELSSGTLAEAMPETVNFLNDPQIVRCLSL
jgi:rSAM/selenodomain-associated transferase 1